MTYLYWLLFKDNVYSIIKACFVNLNKLVDPEPSSFPIFEEVPLSMIGGHSWFTCTFPTPQARGRVTAADAKLNLKDTSMSITVGIAVAIEICVYVCIIKP